MLAIVSATTRVKGVAGKKVTFMATVEEDGYIYFNNDVFYRANLQDGDVLDPEAEEPVELENVQLFYPNTQRWIRGNPFTELTAIAFDYDWLIEKINAGTPLVDGIPNRIAEIAEHYAAHNAHGYSQPNRGTGGPEVIQLSDGTTVTINAGDVDCSEMVRQCVNGALGYEAIRDMWTGDEPTKLAAVGFINYAYPVALVRGDIMYRNGHTAVYVGNDQIAEAAWDEYGGTSGPTAGDQTGDEVRVAAVGTNWARVFRWGGTVPAPTTTV